MTEINFYEETNDPIRKYLVLVIYDISDDKRRVQFVKILQAYGFRIQKSAFEAHLDKKRYQQLILRISDFASNKESIRVYRVSCFDEIKIWGENPAAQDEDYFIF